MEIRVKAEVAGEFKTLAEKYKSNIQITVDDNAVVPIFLAKDNASGELREIMRGEKELKSLLHYGYNRIIKFCPHLNKTCIGEECQLYFVDGITSDCSLVWTAIMVLGLFKRNAG